MRSLTRSAGMNLELVPGWESWSRPVSRVLWRTIIPLGSPSPATSSGLPGSTRGHALPLSRRLPYLALLQVGFAVPSVLPRPRCALTAPFHPCQFHCWNFGGLLSVALSVGSRRPGVTWHLVRKEPGLSSPFREKCSDRPADSGAHHTGMGWVVQVCRPGSFAKLWRQLHCTRICIVALRAGESRGQCGGL